MQWKEASKTLFFCVFEGVILFSGLHTCLVYLFSKSSTYYLYLRTAYVFSHFNSCNRSTFPAFHFSACKQQYHSKVGVDIFTNLLYFCPPQTRDHCFLECRKGLFSSRPFKVIQLSLGLYTAMKITTNYSNVVILQSNSFQNYYFRVYEEQ